jgi:nitrite reductase/ring-hydroxylating ferredoxin subunit
MSAWVWAAKVGDIAPEKANVLKLGGRSVALYRIGDDIHATSGLCPHEGECFDSGFVEHGTVECALHYAVFDIATGKKLSGPATKPLPVYPVRRDGDDVYVSL